MLRAERGGEREGCLSRVDAMQSLLYLMELDINKPSQLASHLRLLVECVDGFTEEFYETSDQIE
jgi:hypothetical protein